MSAISKQALGAQLLRLVTCGSVDDGKSTLIGRLLFDTKQIFVDQLEHIEDVSRRRDASSMCSSWSTRICFVS